MIESIVQKPPMGHRDHCCLVFRLNLEKQLEPTVKARYINDHKGNYLVNGELSSINWKEKVENMNCIQAWETFSAKVMSKLNKYIPKFKINRRKRKTIYTTREALALHKSWCK